MSSAPLYPDIVVQLSGEDGNIFFIAGRVGRALKRAGHPKAAETFYSELEKAPNYDAALALVQRTVNVE